MDHLILFANIFSKHRRSVARVGAWQYECTIYIEKISIRYLTVHSSLSMERAPSAVPEPRVPGPWRMWSHSSAVEWSTADRLVGVSTTPDSSMIT